MILDLLNEGSVLRQDKVDSGSFSSETTCSTNSVNVVLLFEGKLVVDNEADLLNINTSCEKICGNENTN